MNCLSYGAIWTTLFVITLNVCNAYSSLDTILTNSLLQAFVNRDDLSLDEFLNELPPQPANYPSFEARQDERDNMNIENGEYLEQNLLTGLKSMEGGNGEVLELLKPDGSILKDLYVKTDTLPIFFCNAANPCPLGFNAENGCLEEFENTARFSREYQAAQSCPCDFEHMFDCPGATRENKIDAFAQPFENEGLALSALDKLMPNMDATNPFLEGKKLPVVAKKTPRDHL